MCLFHSEPSQNLCKFTIISICVKTLLALVAFCIFIFEIKTRDP